MSEIEIPQEVLDRLSACSRTEHPNARVWEPWEDEIICRYIDDPNIRKVDIAQELGCSPTTMYKRAEALRRVGKLRPKER